MKAPVQIYLNRKHPEPYWFIDKQVDSDIEYIRKDALLELLKRMIQSCKTKNGFPAGTLAAVRIETLEAVIYRIEEICKEEKK